VCFQDVLANFRGVCVQLSVTLPVVPPWDPSNSARVVERWFELKVGAYPTYFPSFPGPVGSIAVQSIGSYSTRIQDGMNNALYCFSELLPAPSSTCGATCTAADGLACCAARPTTCKCDELEANDNCKTSNACNPTSGSGPSPPPGGAKCIGLGVPKALFTDYYDASNASNPQFDLAMNFTVNINGINITNETLRNPYGYSGLQLGFTWDYYGVGCFIDTDDGQKGKCFTIQPQARPSAPPSPPSSPGPPAPPPSRPPSAPSPPSMPPSVPGGDDMGDDILPVIIGCSVGGGVVALFVMAYVYMNCMGSSTQTAKVAEATHARCQSTTG